MTSGFTQRGNFYCSDFKPVFLPQLAFRARQNVFNVLAVAIDQCRCQTLNGSAIEAECARDDLKHSDALERPDMATIQNCIEKRCDSVSPATAL